MDSHGSPNISSANKNRIKSVEEFQQLLKRFNELNQSFLQSVQTFRRRVEPGMGTRIFNTIIPPKSASTRPTDSTPLLSLKQKVDNESDKESLSKLNAFLEMMHREERLQHASMGCDRFLKLWQQEIQAQEGLSNQLLLLEKSTRNEFQEDLRSRDSSIKIAKESAKELYNALQDFSVSFSALKEFEGQLDNVQTEVADEVISFGAQALAFHQKNQDKDELKRLVRQVPTRDLLAQIPREVVKFNDLEGIIIRNLKKNWGQGDSYAAEMEAFQQQYGNLSDTLIKMLSALRQQAQTCESIKWDDLKASLKTIDAKLAEEVASKNDLHKKERESIVQLINPLLSEKRILSSEEKKQQIDLISAAFDGAIDKVSSQTSRMQKIISEIDALESSVPSDLKPFMLMDDEKKAIDKMTALYHSYQHRVDFLMEVPTWARYYSDQHVIMLLERLRSIVTKEDYDAICKQAGVSIDLSLNAVIERHKSKIDKVANDAFIASNYFHASDMFLTLNNMRVEFGLDFITALCADGGGEAARKVLEVGVKFLVEANKRFLAQYRMVNFVNKEAKELIDSAKANQSFNRAQQLFQGGKSKREAAEKYSQVKVNQIIEEQQEAVMTRTATLKNKWLTQPEWDKKISGTLYANSKSIERLNNMQKMVEDIGRFFAIFDALHFPAIDETGSQRYQVLAAQFNELIKLAQVISLATADLLENNASLLKVFMSEFETQINDKLEVQRKSLLSEFQAACAGMHEEVEDAVSRHAKLDKKHEETLILSEVLPRLESQKRAFKALHEKYKKRVDIISSHIKSVYDPLLGSNELDSKTGLSLGIIEKEWLNPHIRPFVAGDYFEQFKREEEKRQKYIKEAIKWAEDFKPNLAILSDMKALWESVCLAEAAAPVELHNVRVEDLVFPLESARLRLTDKISANTRIVTLILGLKNHIQHLLSTQLEQANEYSREMVSCIVDTEMQSQTMGIWYEVSSLARKNTEETKNPKEGVPRLFYELSRDSVTLKSILDENNGFNPSSNGYFNYVYESEGSLMNFVGSMKSYVEKLKRDYPSPDEFVSSKKQLFAGEVTRTLRPIMEIQHQVTIKEETLRAGHQAIASEVSRLSQEAQGVKQSFNALLSDLEVVPLVVSNGHIVSGKELMSEEIRKQLTIIQNRAALSENKDDVLISSDLNAFNTVITSAIMAMLDDDDEKKKQVPLATILRAKKDELAQNEAVIDQQMIVCAGLQARQKDNARVVEVLKSEKTRLQGLPRLTNVIELAAARFESVKRNIDAVKSTNAKFERSRQALLTKKNTEYVEQLKQLHLLLDKSFEMLKAGSGILKSVWIGYLSDFDAGKYSGLGSQQNDRGFFKSLGNEVKPNFDCVVKATSLQDFVSFPFGKENNYARLRRLSNQILITVNAMLKEEDFFYWYEQNISEPFVKNWKQHEPIMWDVYRTEMQKVTDLYRWLISASEQMRLYDVLESVSETVSSVEIEQLDKWVEQWITPFLSEYNQLVEREKQIAALDEALAKINAEQSQIEIALTQQPALISASALIKTQLDSVASLEASITIRPEQIKKFKLDKRAFYQAKEALFAFDESLFEKVSGDIFKRFRYIFLSDVETKTILDDLRGRAASHKKEENKLAINAFVEQVPKCTNNLAQLAQHIQKPVKDGFFNENEPRVSLNAERGVPTKTCKLIQRLDGVMKRLIKHVETALFLADMEAAFADRKTRLSKLEEEKPFDFIFDYYCTAIELALGKIKTNLTPIFNSLQEKLTILKASNDDEMSNLKQLRTIIESEYKKVNEWPGGSPMLFGMIKGSKLGEALKEQLEILDQVLAFDPAPIRSLRLSGDH